MTQQPIKCRGVRGAITATENTAEAILEATRELLTALAEANQIDPDDVGSIIFSTTPDLNAQYPAVAARELGWYDLALLCTHEMDVPHGLKQVVRVLIMWNTTCTAQEIQHIYLRGAQSLRPDRSAQPSLDQHRNNGASANGASANGASANAQHSLSVAAGLRAPAQ